MLDKAESEAGDLRLLVSKLEGLQLISRNFKDARMLSQFPISTALGYRKRGMIPDCTGGRAAAGICGKVVDSSDSH